ncbi:MAG: hypothetical protein IKQ51_11230 [Bacteroidaceae bacterium]|nr:hypothetical protein [Bacteroidaceae bacterium]
MIIFRETHTWSITLGLLLLFTLAAGARAQEKGIRFLVKPAVHEYMETDREQELANAFMYEGKFDKYRKWEIQSRDKFRKMDKAHRKKMKKIKDEDVKDSLDEIYRRQRRDLSRQPNPYPKYNYVVIIKPPFEPLYYGFAVEKEKLVYITWTVGGLESSTIEISAEVAKAMRSLIDNITLSARITDDIPRVFDGSTYNIIRGHFPTHMVESHGDGNSDEGAVCCLLEKVCEAAKSKDAATINAQLKEIKRLDAVYSALK